MLGRIATLEQATLALLENSLSDALAQQAEREAHKLVGSLGTFGLAQGSKLAREIEHILQAGSSLGQIEVLRLSQLVVALHQELEQSSPQQAQGSSEEDHKSPTVLVINGDTEFTDRLLTEAARRDIRPAVVSGLAAARDFLSYECPDVVLLVLSCADITEGVSELLANLAKRNQPVPVLVLADENGLIDRVEIARLGGQGFLPKSSSAAQVLDAVAHALPQGQAQARVLAVDDDPQVLAILEALLQPRGLALTTLDDPQRLWEVLQETSPDLLILDVDMPQLNGVELCRVVRNDPHWNRLPVLFLTAHTDAETAHKVFAAGADDFVTKPIAGPELITKITNRLERTRLLQKLADTDVLTGLANRQRAMDLLNRFLRLADRQKEHLSLAIVDLDYFKEVNDRYGHECGDNVLRRIGNLLQRSFRSEDVVARWGGEEFLIGMYGMKCDHALGKLTRVLETLRQERFNGHNGTQFQITFSAGVAEYPTDGTDLQTLYRASDQALYLAKSFGRNRVLPVGWSPQRAGPVENIENIDIVLVDDDEVLAEMLLHTLQTQGLRVVWLQDGSQAASLLGGAKPRLQARVALLDINLPGLDGLSVLRRLAQDGILKHTQVIMLTARSNEQETLEALDLGAFDHVAKPFSIPVLMHRIRRAMRHQSSCKEVCKGFI